VNFEEHDVPLWAVGLEDGIVYKVFIPHCHNITVFVMSCVLICLTRDGLQFTHYIWDVNDPKEAYEPMTDLTEHLKKCFAAIAKDAGGAPAAATDAPASDADKADE
jgi:hypothetical protein